MEEQSLAISFDNSLTEEVFSCVNEFVEIGIDSMMEDGLMKDIPFISTAVSIYKIGKSVRERQHIKKLAKFLREINRGATDEDKRKEYREKFMNSGQYRNQELEYIMILIDRYIDANKPALLAKLYLAYLDGTVNWNDFVTYAEVIDRFLLGDSEFLTSYPSRFPVTSNFGDAHALRLAMLGLVTEIEQTSKVQISHRGHTPVVLNSLKIDEIKVREYQRTEFGEKLASILT
jgi:hypothetical protein